jgi:hypothetical protein
MSGQFDGVIKAALVWDGGSNVVIPQEMGVPRADQMQGTTMERLAELAGRVCYDSLGSGRPSFDQLCSCSTAQQRACKK